METTVKLRHVKVYSSRGKTFAYFRPTGERFTAAIGTPEFVIEHQAKMASLGKRKARPDDADLPGTVGGLVTAFQASPEFKDLAPATQRDYRWYFKLLHKIMPMPIVDMDEAAAIALRDTMAKRGFRVANLCMAYMSRLWKWGRPRKITTAENPFKGIEKVKRPRGKAEANRPWKDAELEAMMARATPSLKVVIALGRYGGLRKADIARFDRTKYDGSALCYITQKSEGQAVPIEVWLPCPRALRVILDGATWHGPKTKGGQGDALKRPIDLTADGIDTAFGRLRDKLLEEKLIEPGLTLHGLRHTAADELAEAGANDTDIAAVLGQRSLTMARHYSRRAKQRRRARRALELVEGGRQ